MLLYRTLIVVLLFGFTYDVEPSPLSVSDSAILKQSIALGSKGAWDKAEFLGNKLENPTAKKVLYWMMIKNRSSGIKFNTIKSFISENPNWSDQELLIKRAEQAVFYEDDKIAEKWLTEHPPTTPEGKVKLAEILTKKNYKKHYRQIDKLVSSAWKDDTLSYTVEKRILKKFPRYINQRDYIARIDNLLWNKKIKKAKRLMPKVNRSYRKLFKARIAMMRKSKGVDRLVRAVPKNLRKDDGLIFQRVKWRHNRKNKKGALAMLKTAPRNSRYPEKWWVYKEYYARYLVRKKQYTKAYRLAKSHSLKSGAKFAKAEWLCGWIALQNLKHKKTAYSHFKKLFKGVNFATTKSRAGYWAGITAPNKETSEAWFKANATYGATYYGQLSALKLGDNVTLSLPSPIMPNVYEKNLFYNKDTTQAVLILSQIGYNLQAYRFMKGISDNTDDLKELTLIADLGEKIGRLDYTVKISKRILRKNIALTKTGYPVISLKQKENEEKALILAVIRQESEFHIRAKSHAGARGIMQIMPQTAKQVAKKNRFKYSLNNLHNSHEYNIKLGSTYLKSLLKRFDGSYPLALAAYNAGPGRVRRWQKSIGDPLKGEIDMVEWIEKIPYSETKNYVMRVMENIQVYRHRLGGENKSIVLLAKDLDNEKS